MITASTPSRLAAAATASERVPTLKAFAEVAERAARTVAVLAHDGERLISIFSTATRSAVLPSIRTPDTSEENALEALRRRLGPLTELSPAFAAALVPAQLVPIVLPGHPPSSATAFAVRVPSLELHTATLYAAFTHRAQSPPSTADCCSPKERKEFPS